MRPIALVLLSCVFVYCSSSATESAESALELGSVGLGGSISYQSTDIDNADHNLTTIVIAPSAMVYLYEGLAVGFELSFHQISAGQDSDVTHRYLGKVQYAFPFQSKIIPFIHGGVGFIRDSRCYYNWFWSTQHESEKGWTMEFGIGLYAFLNDHFALKARADYFRDTLTTSEGDSPSIDNFMLTIGFEGFIF